MNLRIFNKVNTLIIPGYLLTLQEQIEKPKIEMQCRTE